MPTQTMVIGGSPTDRYKITDIDLAEGDSYFGYVDKDGSWYIMNLTATTARYKKGDGNYIESWDARGDPGYDYFDNVF